MNYDRTKKIVIQGIPGAFHEIAARYYHGKDIEVVPADTFEQVVVGASRWDGGMMAIENSIAGSLMYNYTLLRNASLRIIGELYLRIRHNLLALPGQQIEDLREVHSHPMAIAQCRDFFKAHPHIRLVETEDTAASARAVQRKKAVGIGAIASSMAAELYELNTLAAGIETNKQNYTRFLALDKEAGVALPEQCDKVSLCFALKHTVGSLHRVLATLADEGANLTKIQSVPIVGNRWHYLFFIDFILPAPAAYTRIINLLRAGTTELKILGHYQSGKHYDD